jgi:hypothetical protein
MSSGSRLEVAEHSDEKGESAQDYYAEPEVKYSVRDSQKSDGSEGNLGNTEKTPEFGHAAFVAVPQEALQQVRVGPVADKKDRA